MVQASRLEKLQPIKLIERNPATLAEEGIPDRIFLVTKYRLLAENLYSS